MGALAQQGADVDPDALFRRIALLELNPSIGFGVVTSGNTGAANLTVMAAADRTLSAGLSRVLYEDNAAFTEPWANLTAWTVQASSTLSVSGGKLVNGNGTAGGANSSANHSFALTAGQNFIMSVNVTTDLSGDIIIGTAQGTAGGIPPSGGSDATGFYFNGANLRQWNKGTSTLIGAITADTYTVTITADANWITFVAVPSGQGKEYQYKVARGGVTINNLFAFNSVVAGTAVNIGPLFARKALAPNTPASNTAIGHSPIRYAYWTQATDGTSGVRIMLPSTYDPRVPSPVVFMFHGNGSNENIWSGTASAQDGNSLLMAQAFLAQGYIVCAAAYTPNTSSWGAQGSLDAYYQAYLILRANFTIGPIVFYGNSMGGIESLLSLAESRIPGVVAWVGTSPTASLAANYANAAFTSTIATAYSISGGNYATQTAGHDPLLKAGYAFRNIPMLFLAASDDTVVLKAQNTDPMAALIAPYAPVTVVTTTGGHGFNFAPYASQITAFCNGYVRT